MDHELSHLICPEFTKTLVNIFSLNIYLPFRLSGGGLKSGTFETMANVGCDTACVFVGKKKKQKIKQILCCHGGWMGQRKLKITWKCAKDTVNCGKGSAQ